MIDILIWLMISAGLAVGICAVVIVVVVGLEAREIGRNGRW